MARSGPSPADAALIAGIREYGEQISHAQLDRSRRDGILRRNQRHGRGRGRGSTSRTLQGAVEAAAAFARFTRQGQSRHIAVLRWFAQAGLPLQGRSGPPIPEPPIEPFHRAISWFDRRDLTGMLAALVPPTPEDEGWDQVYVKAQRLVDRARLADPLLSDRMRAVVLTGSDLSGERERVRRTRDAIVQSLVAQMAGPDEIGSDLLVDALTSIGALPAGSSSAIKVSMRADELAGRPPIAEIGPATGHRRIATSTATQLRQARDTARSLLAIAGLLQMLRWAAPDTAALNATAAVFERYGLGMLLRFGLAITEPGNLLPVTIAMLDPFMAALTEQLLAQLPPHPFGDMQTQVDGMLRNLKAATDRDV